MKEGARQPQEAQPDFRPEFHAQQPDEAKGEKLDVSLEDKMKENAEMYRLPGDEPLTEKNVERYLESVAVLKDNIETEIEEGLNNDDYKIRKYAAGLIGHVSEKKREQLIQKAWTNEKPDVRKHVSKMIGDLPKGDQTKMLEQALGDSEKRIRKNATEQINQLPEAEDRLRLLKDSLLALNEPGLRLRAAEQIDSVPEGDRAQLIEDAFENIKESKRVRVEALSHIGQAAESDRARLIEKGLNDPLNDIQELAAAQIDCVADEKEQAKLRKKLAIIADKKISNPDKGFPNSVTDLIEHLAEEDKIRVQKLFTPMIDAGFDQDDEWLQKSNAVRLIPFAPEAERVRLIQKGLEVKESAIREYAAEQIGHAPKADRAKLIEKAVRDENYYVRLQAIKQIGGLSQEEQKQFIEPLLKNSRGEMVENIVKLVAQLPEETREEIDKQVAELVKKGIKNWSRQWIPLKAAKYVGRIPEADRLKAIEEMPQGIETLKKLAAETPLYKDQPEKFFRGKLKKSGYETTLLDSAPGHPEHSLRDKLIVRKIKLGPLLSWQKAYEATDSWKEAGFDYVPVEPIVKVNKKEGMDVDVYTRVLNGPSIAEWGDKVGLYTEEIVKQREKIKEVLKELEVQHGHVHDLNLIAVFDKDEKGEPILERPPRVYVIDFDMAVSSGK